jgi:hypothetical protein
MLRRCYIWLICQHPPEFRRRFAAEMLGIYDQMHGRRGWLFFDAARSVIRQHVTQQRHPEPVLSTADGAPRFQTIAPYSPAWTAMMEGGIITVALLCLLAYAGTHGSRRLPFLIGSYHGAGFLHVTDASNTASGLDTRVVMPEEKADPMRDAAAAYFRSLAMLRALDADGNLELSSWEILTAPSVLRKLDTNRDGQLSAEECGFTASAGLDPRLVAYGRETFMTTNPVLRVLDADHDGIISGTEMLTATPTLRSLDRNVDGKLSASELLPDPDLVWAVLESAAILEAVDTDGDAGITTAERLAPRAARYGEIIVAADRDHNGISTRTEVTAELRLRRERQRQQEAAEQVLGHSATTKQPSF